MSKKVEAWLRQEGMFEREIEDGEAYFHFVAKHGGSDVHFEVIYPKKSVDSVVIVSGLNIAHEHIKNMDGLGNGERAEFLWGIKFGLLFEQTAFNLLPNGQRPEVVKFTRHIYFDGLTKEKLMEVIRENYRCNLFVIWKFMERFVIQSKTGNSQPLSMYQ